MYLTYTLKFFSSKLSIRNCVIKKTARGCISRIFVHDSYYLHEDMSGKTVSRLFHTVLQDPKKFIVVFFSVNLENLHNILSIETKVLKGKLRMLIVRHF